MKKFAGQLLLVASGVCMFATCAWAASFDNFDQSLKDAERSMRMQREQQTQQKLDTDIRRFDMQNSFADDKAVKKNEELLQKLIEAQNRDMGEEMDMWMKGFWKKNRFIIEMSAIVIFIMSFSMFFYRKNLNKMEQEKKELEQPYRHPGYRG